MADAATDGFTGLKAIIQAIRDHYDKPGLTRMVFGEGGTAMTGCGRVFGDLASEIHLTPENFEALIHRIDPSKMTNGAGLPGVLTAFYQGVKDLATAKGAPIIYTPELNHRMGVDIVDFVRGATVGGDSPVDRLKLIESELGALGLDAGKHLEFAAQKHVDFLKLKNAAFPSLNEAQGAFEQAKASALKAAEELRQAAAAKAEEFRVAAEARAVAAQEAAAQKAAAELRAAQASEAAAANGGRKWFQMLTHSAEGHFSGARTGVTTAAVAAVAAGGLYLATRNPKKDPDAKWVDRSSGAETATGAHR